MHLIHSTHCDFAWQPKDVSYDLTGWHINSMLLCCMHHFKHSALEISDEMIGWDKMCWWPDYRLTGTLFIIWQQWQYEPPENKARKPSVDKIMPPLQPPFKTVYNSVNLSFRVIKNTVHFQDIWRDALHMFDKAKIAFGTWFRSDSF